MVISAAVAYDSTLDEEALLEDMAGTWAILSMARKLPMTIENQASLDEAYALFLRRLDEAGLTEELLRKRLAARVQATIGVRPREPDRDEPLSHSRYDVGCEQVFARKRRDA